MLCNSVRAVFVGAVFTSPVGWLEVFLQATETCPNSEKKITSRQGLKNAENSNCSSSNGFGPTLTTMTKLFAGWSAILTKLPAGFPRPFVEPPTCFRVNRVVIFSRCPQIVILFAVLFVDCEEWFCLLLGSLPGAHHAIVCILFSLEQSRVVD